MDTIKFAQLVNWLTFRNMTELGSVEMQTLYDMVNGDPVVKEVPVAGKVDEKILAELLSAMHDKRKIDAIKLHRQLTGIGLKEAKDEIEKYI